MSKFICLLFFVISSMISQSNSQPADMDPTKLAASVAAGATNALSKALNTTKSIIPINPADIATKGAGLIPALLAACQNFISQILGVLTSTGSAPKLPGMDIASQFMKTGGEIMSKPIEAGQVVVKDVLKIMNPSSGSPDKAPAAANNASDAKPGIVGSVEKISQNVVGSLFKAFDLF